MAKDKKAKKRNTRPGEKVSYHHFCFEHRNWKQGYAKALRNHWYCGQYLPICLHDELHGKIHNVPTPNGALCKQVYMELCRMENSGEITSGDPPWVRLDFLIGAFYDTCPEAATVFSKQKQLILRYLSARPY